MLTNLIIKLLDLFIAKGVTFLTTITLLGLSVPFLLVMTIPMSVLLAVLVAFSRFSADSETTAMKSSGISISRMMPPVIVFATLVYILTSSIYIGLLPITNLKLKQLRYDIIRKQANIGIKPHVFNTDFTHLVIYVNEIDHSDKTMHGIFIADNRNTDHPLVIVARKGFDVIDPEKNVVTLRLKDGCTHEIMKGKHHRYSTTPFSNMDLKLDMTILAQAAVTKSDREMTIAELIHKARRNEEKGRSSNRQWIEIWKKTSFPFACFIFAFLGVPLGLTTRRGGKSANFATSIGLILVYYILLTGGTGLSEESNLSPLLATWSPNILLGCLSLYLYYRQAKESPPPHFKQQISESTMRIFKKIQQIRYKRHSIASTKLQFERLPFGVRILDRYIAKQFLTTFIYVQAALMAISLIVHGFEKIDNLVEHHATLMDSFVAICFNLPYFAYLAIHFSTLVATILTIGLFNRTSELAAMKASGISYIRITVPLFVIAIGISSFAFFLNESIVPLCNRKVEQTWDRIKNRERTQFVRYHRWYRGATGDIYYFQHYDRKEISITGFSRFHIDKHMNILDRIESDQMVWTDGYWEGLDGRSIQMSSSGQVISDKPFPSKTINIPETPADFSKEYKESEEMNLKELKEYIQVLQSIGFDTTEYEVDWHAKFSIPFLSIIMVLIGMAFSSQNPRTATGLKGLGTAIVIGAVYFVIFRISLELGHGDKFPSFMAAWMCNIIFLVMGFWWLIKVSQR